LGKGRQTVLIFPLYAVICSIGPVPGMTRTKVSMKLNIPPLLLFFACFLPPSGAGCQDMAAIDSFFLNYPAAIRTEVNGQAITNDFPLYKRVVLHNTGRPMAGFYLEDRVMPGDMDFYGGIFRERISTNQVVFQKSMDMTLAHFHEPVKIQSTDFEKQALFNWARFAHTAFFSRASFLSETQFIRAAFDSSANINFCRFDENAFFYGSMFNGQCSFNDTKFNKDAVFSFCDFKSSLKYNRSAFSRIVLFNNVHFRQGGDFTNATFDSLADFSNAVVNGKLDFTGVDLPEYMDMSGMQEIDGIIDLMRVKSGTNSEECRINLLNSDISKFHLSYEHFRLYFPPGTAYNDKVSVYEDLLENFKARELNDSYQALDIAFSQFKYKEKRQSAANLVQKFWWNYGYDKNMIFVWIFRILLFFTAINTFFIRKLITAITELPFLSKKTVEKHHLHHPIIAYFLNFPGTLLYTFILLVSGSSGLSIIKDHSKIPNVVWMLYMIILSLVGLSISIFIFNYIIN
jgi:hypothetical protein